MPPVISITAVNAFPPISDSYEPYNLQQKLKAFETEMFNLKVKKKTTLKCKYFA
jgi:hypothetical protein